MPIFSDPITYDLGCPSAAGLGGKAPSANTCPADSLSFDDVYPTPGKTILIPAMGQDATTGITRTPPFIASMKYVLQSKTQGVVSLELRNQDAGGKPGRLIGVSTGINVSKGPGEVARQIDPFSFFGQINIDDSNTTQLVLRAILADPATGQTLATSDPMVFPAGAAKVSLVTLLKGNDLRSSVPVDPAQVRLFGFGFDNTSSAGDGLGLRVAYSLPGDLRANLSLRKVVSSRGKLKSFNVADLSSDPVFGSKTQDYSIPGGVIDPEADTENLAVAMSLVETGQTVLSNTLQVGVDGIMLVTVAPDPDSALTAGGPIPFDIDLSAITHDAGRKLVRHVFLKGPDRSTDQLVPAGSLQPDKRLDLDDKFSLDVSTDVSRIVITYSINDPGQGLTLDLTKIPSSRILRYSNFLAILSLLRSGANSAVPFAQGILNAAIPPMVDKAISDYKIASGILQDPRGADIGCRLASGSVNTGILKVPGYIKAILRYYCPPGTFTALSHAEFEGAREAGNSSNPDLIALSTWTFDPPIPNDGSFAGDITFNYSAADLPDDPNFDESKLQVVTLDNTTGAITVIPSRVDATKKTVTAHITQLAPIYTLAVVGPFSNSSLAFTDATGASALSLVNVGNAPVPVTLRGFSTDATASGGVPPAVTVPAFGQYLSGFSKTFGSSATDLRWVRADVSNTQTAGAEMLTSGTAFDVLPAAAQASFGPWIVTTAEQSGFSSTSFV